MQRWLERAREAVWPDWSAEETSKIKLLFLESLGRSFARRGEEEGERLAEHLESFGGEEQAMLFASGRMVPAPQAVLGNVMLGDQPLLFPTVLAAIEMQNKGGKELLSALGAGLEATARMGDHPQAECFGAIVGVANAFELDEDGWQLLLGVLNHRDLTVRSGMARALFAHDLLMIGSLARELWSEERSERGEVPADWLAAINQSTDFEFPALIKVIEVDQQGMIAAFRERVAGKIPEPHIEYYIDAVMGMEDICCVPLFFRR